ncbi:claudin-4 [Paramisgurnus dabryanus]|uniref:claudin-4 n=1 Tax=Paramisgurnus dabryanus TaxID=90735 RepID=UPI0031F4440A
MASLGMQMLASALALLGWVGALLSCIMPLWRVTAFVGTTIVTSETMWEGIWMSCVTQSTGQIQCKPYESTLALTTDLQAARALMVMAILTGAAGLVLAFFGGKCTIFMARTKSTKAKIATAAGVSLIVAGILCLIPVSWSAGIVVNAFYNPQLTDSQRREIGGAIYVGWGASILLLLSGGILCTTICMGNTVVDDGPSVKYLVVRSSRAGSSMAGSQRMRPLSVRSLQNGAPSVQSQWSQKAPPFYHQGRPPSTISQQSKPSTTKSQLMRAELSEESEGASTKYQLNEKGLDQTLATSEPYETSADPSKSYI